MNSVITSQDGNNNRAWATQTGDSNITRQNLEMKLVKIIKMVIATMVELFKKMDYNGVWFLKQETIILLLFVKTNNVLKR
jgi:hypothetical protein